MAKARNTVSDRISDLRRQMDSLREGAVSLADGTARRTTEVATAASTVARKQFGLIGGLASRQPLAVFLIGIAGGCVIGWFISSLRRSA